jgi:tetratricopeptide (TPR) repeat protein
MSARTTRAAWCAAATIVFCAAAWADKVVVYTSDRKGEIPYDNVTITDVKDCRLIYRSGASTVTKDLKDVVTVRVDGQDKLNEAELLMKAGKPDEALEAYAEADKAAPANKPWMKQLIRLRRLPALRQLQKIDTAVADWLGIVDESGASKIALAMGPGKEDVPKKGAAGNAKAVALLEAKQGELKDKKDYLQAVEWLLVHLYDAEGQEDKATGLREKLAGLKTPTTASTGRGVEQLRAVKELIDRKGVGRDALEGVLKTISTNLDRYAADDLPVVLLVAGRAKLALYEQGGKKDRAPLTEAGLDLMRVYAHFPDSKEAPEALFYAGQVNLALGNRNGARAAYEAVVRGYPKDAIAAKAGSAIEAMKDLK